MDGPYRYAASLHGVNFSQPVGRLLRDVAVALGPHTGSRNATRVLVAMPWRLPGQAARDSELELLSGPKYPRLKLA